MSVNPFFIRIQNYRMITRDSVNRVPVGLVKRRKYFPGGTSETSITGEFPLPAPCFIFFPNASRMSYCTIEQRFRKITLTLFPAGFGTMPRILKAESINTRIDEINLTEVIRSVFIVKFNVSDVTPERVTVPVSEFI